MRVLRRGANVLIEAGARLLRQRGARLLMVFRFVC